MDYYEKFNNFLDDKEKANGFFTNRFTYMMLNMPQFVGCNEYNIKEVSLTYTFEHIYKAIVVILSYFIPRNERRNLWKYNWEDDDFRNQLYDSLIGLHHKHIMLWFFIHCSYYDYPDYDVEIKKLKSNMEFIINKGLKFENILELYENPFGKTLGPFYALTYRNQNNKDIMIERCKFYRTICPELVYNSVGNRKVRTSGKLKIGFISNFQILKNFKN